MPYKKRFNPEGDTNFTNLLPKIEKICHQLSVPVIAKEVGWGFSGKTARKLADAGVQAIDVAGAGGTSWSQVESHRATDKAQAKLARSFVNWGIPTAESIKMVKEAAPELLIFSSGGIRSGIDIAKSIALGASLGGMASVFLKAAVDSTEKVVEEIKALKRQLSITMFSAGIKNINELQPTNLIYRP